jgi:beta-lactamase class A
VSVKETVSSDQAAFSAAMDEHFAKLGGTVGLMVHEFATGRKLTYNHEDVFPTASTLKVPLLYALYRQADAGQIDLTARVTLRHADRVPGSGVYQALDEGLRPTVRDLAELMITVSDNYATDLLYRMVGGGKLAQTLKELDLNQTFLPLTTWQLLSHMGGLDPEDPELTYDGLRERLKNGPWDENGIAYAEDERNDISSPADMVRLLELVENGHGLSPGSREGVIRILKNQNFSTIIPPRLPENRHIETAHKTGSIKGVRNDVGIVYSPHLTYAIAFMSKGQKDAPEAVLQMARASRWIWDFLSEHPA